MAKKQTRKSKPRARTQPSRKPTPASGGAPSEVSAGGATTSRSAISLLRTPFGQFAWRYVLFAAVLLSIYAFPYSEIGLSEQWFQDYLAGYAQLVGWVLGAFEPNLRVHDTMLTGRASLQIVKSCDAMEAKLLFAAAVLAFPGLSLRKLAILVGGLATLVALNVLRITTLYYVLAWEREAFEFMHTELWPLLMIAATGGLFLASMRFLQPAEVAPPAEAVADGYH